MSCMICFKSDIMRYYCITNEFIAYNIIFKFMVTFKFIPVLIFLKWFIY